MVLARWLLLATLAPSSATAAATMNLYVAPSGSAQVELNLYVAPSGSDAAAGTIVAPLASCAGAVARIKAQSAPLPSITVHFAPGTYPLTNSTACGAVSFVGSVTAPIVLKGALNGTTHFDASVQLDASQLKPVSDPKVLELIHPGAKGKVLVMPMTAAPGTLEWNGVPLTPSVWPNEGLGYVERVNDVGAVWASGRTKGPRPHCHVCKDGAKSTAAAPCGANISVAGDASSVLPKGDWMAELAAGPGFGGVTTSGYFAYDWYHESHSIAAVDQSASMLSLQFADSSRYGAIESLANTNAAPGRFTVHGLLSEVDTGGEFWYNSATHQLYVYPPEPLGSRWDEESLGTVKFGQWGGPSLIALSNTKYVTVSYMTVSGVGAGSIVSMNGGDHNTVGGMTLKNSNANAVSMAGGKHNKILGCDIYDVGGHISATGSGETEEQLMGDPTMASSNLIANNQMTQVFLRGGGWQLRLPPPGTRLSHNLIHDAAGQIIEPGGPLAMLDHNEVFNTGYVEGDGGVIYTGASLTSGYGMHYRENFVHHSLEVPGLHGRGGIYFDDHQNSESNVSGNVMYKAAGRAFLVNGGAGNNITHNLIVNSGIAIYNQHADNMVKSLPLYDNGTLKRGDKSDYIWKTEQALGVKDFPSIFNSSLAKRFPTFAKLLAVNSTTEGWASAANSRFTNNVFLNNSANICLLTGWHSTPTNPEEFCDDKLPHPGMPQFIDKTGTIDAEFSWFPKSNDLEFKNATLGFDTTKMGLRCDQFRRSLPDPTKFRPWVKQFFDGVPSAAGGKYTPEAASIRASMESGKQLVNEFTIACPPLEKTDCEAVWLAWGECEADRHQVMRYTIEVEPTGGGAECEHEDGFATRHAC